MRRIAPWLILVALAACDRAPFTAPQLLGGRSYSAAQLNHGFRLYQKGCRACHGERGDGHGLSAKGLWPPPRDLTQGLYKFGRAPAPGLPPDADLGRILRGGLDGTGMLPWTLTDDELADLLGYVKTFSPRWRKEPVSEPAPLPPDPYAQLAAPARAKIVVRGEALYHGTALCSTCHPSYVERARLYELTLALNGSGVTAYSPEMYSSRIKETEHCWRWSPTVGEDGERSCAEAVRAVPPDFLHDRTRAVRADQRVADLYLTLATGIGGAGMPPWKGVLPDEDLWAMAYYVASLIEQRATPSGDALRRKLSARDNLDWQPPASPPTP